MARWALFLATTGWAVPAMAEPLPGLWERRFTAFMPDPVSGAEKPWAEPAETRCLSEAELRKLPFLTPSVGKAAYERDNDGSTCTVSQETRAGQAVSWKQLCQEKSGLSVEMRSSTEVSDGEIVATTRMVTQDKAAGATGARIEIRMKRLGDCEGRTVAKP